jgi:hypothetical protein
VLFVVFGLDILIYGHDLGTGVRLLLIVGPLALGAVGMYAGLSVFRRVGSSSA